MNKKYQPKYAQVTRDFLILYYKTSDICMHYVYKYVLRYRMISMKFAMVAKKRSRVKTRFSEFSKRALLGQIFTVIL